MRKTRSAVVGLFVLGGLALAVIGLLAFGGLRWFEPTQEAVVYFDEPLGGLSPGAPVTFRGIEIGSVRRLFILGDPETFSVVMPVYLSLRPGDVVFTSAEGLQGPETIDMDRLVENGLRAQLRPRSLLTGQMAIDLDFYPQAPAQYYHPEGAPAEIPSMRSDFQQARDAIQRFPWEETLDTVIGTLESLESLSRSLETEFAGVGDKVHATLDESRALMVRSRETLDTLDTSATQTLAGFEELSADGRRELGQRSEELREVLASADRTMQRMDRVADELESLSHPRSPERDDLRRALRDLSASAESLRRFSEKVERRPNVLLFDRAEENP